MEKKGGNLLDKYYGEITPEKVRNVFQAKKAAIAVKDGKQWTYYNKDEVLAILDDLELKLLQW